MYTAWPGTAVSPQNPSSSGLDLEPLLHLAELKTYSSPSPRQRAQTPSLLALFPCIWPIQRLLSQSCSPRKSPRRHPNMHFQLFPPACGSKCPIFLDSPFLSSTDTTPRCFPGKKPLGTGVLLFLQSETPPSVSNVEIFLQVLTDSPDFLSTTNTHLGPPPGSRVSHSFHVAHPRLMPMGWVPRGFPFCPSRLLGPAEPWQAVLLALLCPCCSSPLRLRQPESSKQFGDARVTQSLPSMWFDKEEALRTDNYFLVTEKMGTFQ